MQKKNNNIKELIVSQGASENNLDEFVVYVNFKNRTDLFKTEFKDNLELDEQIQKRIEKRKFALTFGTLIYNNIFN